MTVTPAKYGSISFKTLKIYYAEKGYHLEDASFEANLNLRTQNGEYNLLAELLSDKNMVPLITVKFQGTDKASVSDTTVRPRVDRYLFDFDSVNEAVINALVHNDWNVSQPLISLFSDHIEIFSHGGLPKGQTRELMATVIGVTKRTIERTLKKLQEKKLLVRSGAKKSGNWIVIK